MKSIAFKIVPLLGLYFTISCFRFSTDKSNLDTDSVVLFDIEESTQSERKVRFKLNENKFSELIYTTDDDRQL